MFFGGLIIAFARGPVFAAICLAYIPIFIIGVAIFGSFVKKNTIAKLGKLYGLGAHTEETLSAMKLVLAFAQEDITLKKYDEFAEETRDVSKIAAITMGGMSGVFFVLMFGFYIYTYGIASVMLQHKTENPLTSEVYSIAEIVAVSTSIQMSMMIFTGIMPIIPATMRGLICAKKIYDVIERVPLIKSEPGCIENFSLKREISFEKISFRYPTQVEKSREIFSGASFTIKAGTSTAIVGPSGSGKSTIVQLINRFYDPTSGDVCFDEHNVKKLSLKSLRESIGYVS